MTVKRVFSWGLDQEWGLMKQWLRVLVSGVLLNTLFGDAETTVVAKNPGNHSLWKTILGPVVNF
jgi:hypothetical protein